MNASPPTAPGARNVRGALRAATADLHAQVDTCMPLARPEPTLDDYRAHLELLYSWAQGLRALPIEGVALDAELAALQADIDECLRLQRREPHAPLPKERPANEAGKVVGPATPRSPFAWGIAYVLEGSRLGGQVLYRRLASRLAPHSLSYLRGAGAETGARWKAFVAALDQHVATPAEVEAACEGAVLAFERLLQCQGASGSAE